MSKIRLIAFDLDGTVLDSSGEVPQSAKEVLREARERGIMTIPATGRPAGGLPEELRQLSSAPYVIYLNGGTIARLEDGEIVREKVIRKETACRIADAAPTVDQCLCVICGSCVYEPETVHHSLGKLPGVQSRIVDDIHRFIRETELDIHGFNIFFGDMEYRQRVLDQVRTFPDITISNGLSFNLEINGKNATKGEGLKSVAQMCGIPAEEVMAIGDGVNDNSMLEAAGIGVAMGNALEETKRIADVIADTNDNGGFAKIIRELAF